MSDADSVDADAGAPWLRLAGAILLGFALVAIATDVYVMMLIERAEQAVRTLDGPNPFARRDEAYGMLDMMSAASFCAYVFGGFCVAIALLAFARGTPKLRPLALGTAIAFVASTAYWVRWLAFRFSDELPQDDSFAGWDDTTEVGELVAWSAAAALVVLRTRGGPRRSAALGCAAVALASVLLRFFEAPMTGEEPPSSWWSESMLGLSVGSWTVLAGTVGLGTSLWLAGDPTGDAPLRRFDASAARALRLARTIVWWRLALGVAGIVLMIAGAAAARRAQQTLLVGGSAPRSSPWMLELAPWLGLVEVTLAVAMVVALGAAVLQRRSSLASALTGAGAALLLTVVLGSYAVDMALYDALRSNIPGLGWGGSDVHDYVGLAREMQPTLRWLGLFGMGTTLAGLVVLARITGRGSPLRAFRMLGIALVLTAGWLHGQEALDELGSGALLLAPLVLGAAIWMLLDLVTFLREVADGLDPEPSAPAP